MVIIFKRILYLLICLLILIGMICTFIPTVLTALLLAMLKWIWSGEDCIEKYTDYCFWCVPVSMKLEELLGI